MSLLLPGLRKIAVFRALQLGDMLCAIPAIRALRRAYPDAEITLLGLPWAASLAKRFDKYFNRFIPFPGYPGLPEQPYEEETFNAFLLQMMNERFDLVLQLQGNGTIVNSLLTRFNAKQLAGFYPNSEEPPSKYFIPYPDFGQEANRHLRLMKHLGIPEEGAQLEFPIKLRDVEELNNLLLPVTPGNYVCIHPGSRGSWRQWPPAYFALLADYLNQQGFMPIITGTEEERDITREVRKCLRRPHIDLTGLTSLGALAVLLRDAFLLISNCTGVSHIAAAVQTPGIIISMDGEPHRWGHSIHRMIDWTKNHRVDQVVVQTEAMVNELKAKSYEESSSF